MISKLKIFIFIVVAMSTVCSCTKKENYHIDDETYPGYVAFDYTGNIISNYLSIFKYVNGVNEYMSQTTIEKRDSIDRLYFADAKITYDDNSDMWILRYINPIDHQYMSIDTHGKNLNDNDAQWTILLNGGNYYYKQLRAPMFNIEKIGELNWNITEHENSNYDFDYSSKWNIKLNSSGDIVELEGSGSLLSSETPKLKIDFTITEPLIAKYKNNYLDFISGAIKIHATDVKREITEETIAEVISHYDIRIKYKIYTDSYRYSFLQ